ncbi:MAG: UvrD-helicase domain-containing protein [Gammaproteobacteria bacterium]|nr:UvrD-helicase domain-containing protein [Gammaproteobacteria bacterium]
MHDDDAAARRAALDIRRSFVVQAPAGSGKTTLLTQRLLRLLATVRQPEQVLAITFTRKAAEEMRARIIAALELAGEPRPQDPFRAATHDYASAVLAHDRERGWDLRAQPSRLRIMTIDALCQSIVRQAPISARLASAQSVEEDATLLYREAARETVASIADDAQWSVAVARLLAHFDNDWQKLESLLAEMLARRDQWLRVLHQGAELGALQAGYERVVASDLARVRGLFERADIALGALWAGADGAARILAAVDDGEREIVELVGISGLPAATPDALNVWRGLARLLLKKDGDWRRALDKRQGFLSGKPHAATKQAMLDVIAGLGEIPALDVALRRVLELPQQMFVDGESAVVSALLAALKLAAALFDVHGRRAGRVDFLSFALAAEAALGAPEEPTELALMLDYRLQHLLVDEVQDTSYTQYKLIEALTAGWEQGDGRSLFLVGDPMQSIYRFRQADVRLFTNLLRGDALGGLRLESLRLSANFRAQAALVEWINGVMPVACASVPMFDVPFVVQSAVKPALPSVWSIHAAPDNDRAREAAEVLARVEAIRAVAPDASIAILVRSRSHLGRVTAALVARGHAIAAREIEALGELPCIVDLLALTRALLHEADSIAWLAVLRAPWCGVTLATLQRLTARLGTVLEAVEDDDWCATLEADERQRLVCVRTALPAALAQVGREPLAALVERCWVALGGPALLDHEGRAADVQSYLDLLDALEREDGPLAVERLAQQLAARYSSPPPAADTRLQVMTIHRAKGLEFDYVLVPGCGRKPQADARPLLAWREHHDDDHCASLLLAPSPAKGDSPWFKYLRERDKEDVAAEAVRLLYVALTRAKREVHLLGQVKPGKDDSLPKPEKGSFFAMLWPAIADAALATLASPAPLATAAEPPRGGPPLRRHVLGTLAAPGFSVPVAGSELPLEFDWAGTTAKHIGTVAHRLLQDLAGGGGARAWTPALRGFARGQLRALGVTGDELEGASEEVARAVEATLNSARGRWLFAADQAEVETELCLAVVEQGDTARVIIDRTFVDADGRRWIVDFKTGSHRGGAPEAYLDSELTRYRPQLERYARIMASLDARPIMLGLYFPLLDGWREWPACGS